MLVVNATREMPMKFNLEADEAELTQILTFIKESNMAQSLRLNRLEADVAQQRTDHDALAAQVAALPPVAELTETVEEHEERLLAVEEVLEIDPDDDEPDDDEPLE
jgi:hypothetical protein